MTKTRRLSALILAAALLLASCGSKTAATTMHLVKTEGTVGVADGKGKAVEPREALGLYSGYQVGTRSESYAWIDLDEVKLTKMDQNSDISIQKEDKHLEIVVNSGSLFFNVTQPLAEDETLNIRTASMVVGIRGTCGWVEAPDGEHMNVYLLEGQVECTNGEQTVTVSAGEMAEMTEKPEVPIVVRPFSQNEVKAFVEEEAEPELLEELLSAEPVIEDQLSTADRVIDGGVYEDLNFTSENIVICGNAALGNVNLTSGSVTAYDNVAMGNVTTTSGDVTIYGNVAVGNITTTSGSVTVYGNAAVGNITTSSGYIIVSGNAEVGTLSTQTGAIQDNR